MKTCEVCKETKARYRCPRCELETCCLACVNQHKDDSGCSGQRDKTAFVKISEFNDRHFLSDYRFLEDTAKKNNNAGRDFLKKRHNKPNFLRELEKQAGHRHIDLRFMPYPMTRRKHNSTSYHSRMKKMFWQIEWVFPEADLTFTDKREGFVDGGDYGNVIPSPAELILWQFVHRKICEDDSLESVLDRHVGTDSDPLVKHKLKSYITAGKDKWSLFMKQENTGSQKRFYSLDLAQSLVENFRLKQIVEYPVIHVVLPSHCTQYNIVPTNEEVGMTNESSTKEQTKSARSTEDTPNSEGTRDCKQEDVQDHAQTKPIENVT